MVKKKDDENNIVLTVGSKYRVKSIESKDAPQITHGKFLGYTPIGPDDGFCIELDESHKEMAGRIRVIPSHMIISIDIIRPAEKEDKKEKPASNMFG